MTEEDSLLRLPQHVLSEIFRYLCLRDRKNVRLVCHTCYDACNITRFVGCEQIVPDGYRYSSDYILGKLQASRRVKLNIDFIFLNPVERFPDGFWKKIGDRVVELENVCLTGPAAGTIIEDIIVNCSIMRHFRFHLKESCYMSWCHPDFFDGLIRNNVIRTKLSSLYITTTIDQCDWIGVLEKIVRIFPCVESLRLSLSDGMLNYVQDNAWQNDLNFVQRLMIGDGVDVYDDSTTASIPFASLKNLRLKEFKLDVEARGGMRLFQSLFDFFSHQTRLEIIHLHFTKSQNPTNLLHKILTSFPQLRELKFLFDRDLVKLTNDDLRLLLNSNLMYLETALRFEYYNIATDILALFNDRLWTLIINRYSGDIEVIFLLKHFRKLNRFETESVSTKIIKTIYKMHPQLTDLKLSFIGGLHDRQPFPKNVIPEFIFPKLLEFRFKGFAHTLSWKMATHIICNSPQLELLETNGDPSFTDLMKLIANGHHLVHLIVNYNCMFRLVQYKLLFNASKTLRSITTSQGIFSYDPTTKEINGSKSRNYSYGNG